MTAPTSDDRILDWFRSLVRSVFPRMQYIGVFDYTITAVNGKAPSYTVDCKPVDSKGTGLPELNDVAIQPGISGIVGTPSEGDACVVIFLDANPTKPRIIGIPSLGANPIVRVGDQIMSFFPPTTLINGFITIGPVTSPFVGTILIPNPVTGSVTQGSGGTTSG